MVNAKKSEEKFFCWVRVFDVTQLVSPTPPPPPVKTVPRRTKDQPPFVDYSLVSPQSWKVPFPQAISASLIASAALKQSGPPAGIGEWSVVESVYGRDGTKTSFDIGPAFVSADDAKKWLAEKPEGQQWDREALNRFLICFTYFPEGA
jgi:hypothetical protein